MKVGQGQVINVQDNTKQGSVLGIACMETCVYVFYFLTKLFGGVVHTLNKDAGERVGSSSALA